MLTNPLSSSIIATGPPNLSFHFPSKTPLPFIYYESKAVGKPLSKVCNSNFELFSLAMKNLSQLSLEEKGYSLSLRKSDLMKKRAMNVLLCETDYISNALQMSPNKLIEEIQRADSFHICHGDLNPDGNIIYDIEKKRFALIDFEDGFKGPKQFDQIFFIFHSGEKLWLRLFKIYLKTRLGKELKATNIRQVMIWFMILKLSKLKQNIFLRYSHKQLVRRMKVIVAFKIMTDKLIKYV